MQKNGRDLLKYPYFLFEILSYKTKWVRPSSVLLNILIFVQYISGHHVKVKSMQLRALFCTCKPFVNPRLTGSHVQHHAEFVALKQSATMPVLLRSSGTFNVQGSFMNMILLSFKENRGSIRRIWKQMNVISNVKFHDYATVVMRYVIKLTSTLNPIEERHSL